MMNQKIALWLIAAAVGLGSLGVQADQVIDGNLLVTGAACFGFDCVNGENFAAGELRLKENNLRIRFSNSEVAKDSGADHVFGESWLVEANDSANGGAPYVDFQVKSLIPDNLLSNGRAKAYDCDDLAVTKYDRYNVPSNGLVPVGEAFFLPIVDFASCEFDGALKCLHTCQANTVLQHTVASVLTLGSGSAQSRFGNSVALGFNADLSNSPQSGVVALAYHDLKRQLVHMADAITATDAVNVQGLKFIRVEGMLAQISGLNAALDVIEVRIDDYEASLTVEVDLGVEASTTRLDLTKANNITVPGSGDLGPWGPKGIAFGFSAGDGQALNGIQVLDTQGNSYPLSNWWTVVNLAAGATPVSLLIPEQPGRIIDVQWWYAW
ncbi:MAG: hypothetical protein ACI8WB_001013 [Phenylobacterium sp.]|jgi:hypothetical protein